MKLQALMLFLHVASVTVWVGGMFFAYTCLRPSAGELLEPAVRLRLWRAVFARFFVWVWGAVILIALSGVIMLGQHGMASAPKGWHLMIGSGSVMIVIFIHVATGPFAALKQAVAAEDWTAGAKALNRIRQLVGANLTLGMLTIAFATLGNLI
jgi:uncharacterized membrane protein